MAEAKRILVVDDDEEVRLLLTSTLSRRDLIVDQAADGRAALDLLEQHRYSVVLLDLVMPNIDGFHVLEELAKSPSPPVVLVVTGVERSQLAALDSRRIHGIVRKPFDPDDLSDVVAACVEIRSRGTFEAMAISAMIATGPFLALLTVNR